MLCGSASPPTHAKTTWRVNDPSNGKNDGSRVKAITSPVLTASRHANEPQMETSSLANPGPGTPLP